MNDRHYFLPNRFNKEPYLTIWWMEDPKDTLCFIQMSEDDQKPNWVRFGDVLEMLVRHVRDFENTILKDVIHVLKFHECISADFLKKYLTD